MSYTYLQEQGEESLAASFSDIPASVLSRLNLIAARSCSKDNVTESCQSSKSGMMSEPSTANRGEDSLTLCAGASLAKTFPQPVRGTALTGSNQDFGERWQESLARFDPATHSWRIAQTLLFEDCTELFQTWPRWGMTRRGECFRLETLEHDTSVKGSGLYLPTPTKSDGQRIRFTKEQALKTDYGMSVNSVNGWMLREMNCFQFPEATESLMLWPNKWTDLQPLGMDKFQQWLSSHGKL